jgi:ribonuclease-3
MTLPHPLLKSLTFTDPRLLAQALTHKSCLNEQSDRSLGHNERLEFLGDAVLDLALSDHLMRRFPGLSEGDLSKIRAGLVNETTLAKMALELMLQDSLRLGKGEVLSNGHLKPRLLASVFEALVGAIYLDMGFDIAKQFLFEVFHTRVEAINPQQQFESDYKTRLQELLQEKYRKAPRYAVIKQEGPDHSKTFFVEVRLEERVMAIGSGKSKKQAEQQAAEQALKEVL